MPPRTAKTGKSAPPKQLYACRLNRKKYPRGVRLYNSEEDNQQAHTNVPTCTRTHNVYQRKNPPRVCRNLLESIHTTEECTTVRSIRSDSNCNDADSVNLGGNIAVNQIELEREPIIGPTGGDNHPQTVAAIEDDENEADILYFRNPAGNIRTQDGPNFNHLSTVDAADTSVGVQVDAQTSPCNINGPTGGDNHSPTVASIEDDENEADMLYFRNPAGNIRSQDGPNFNLLSTVDAADTSVGLQVNAQTSPGNINVAEVPNVEVDPAGPVDGEGVEVSPKKARRGRGRTKMKSKGRREPWEAKIELEFDEEGNVCSENATTFANFCGYAVRKYAPLQLKSWEKVPDLTLEAIFKKIMKHYNIPGDLKIMEKILKSCGKKYRAYRTYLKRKYFDAYATNEERLKNTPNRMSKDDWAYLVQFFESQDFQAKSQRNKRNREKQQCYQKLGTSSMAKVKNKMKKEGADSVKYRLYKKTHERANGEPIDAHSKEMMDKIENLARDRGVDLDTAMEMVIPSRRRRDYRELLQSVAIGTDEGIMDVVRERALARAARAEKMVLEAQREVAEAKERTELLEMQLAQLRTEKRKEAKKTPKSLNKKRKIAALATSFIEESSNSEGSYSHATSQESNDEGYSSSDEPTSKQLKHVKHLHKGLASSRY